MSIYDDILGDIGLPTVRAVSSRRKSTHYSPEEEQSILSTLGNHAEFADLLAFCTRHRIRPVIERRYALDGVPEALSRLESGEQFGKLAIEIG